jgi:hypothetical protein
MPGLFRWRTTEWFCLYSDIPGEGVGMSFIGFPPIPQKEAEWMCEPTDWFYFYSDIPGEGVGVSFIGFPPIPQKEAEWMGHGEVQRDRDCFSLRGSRLHWV